MWLQFKTKWKVRSSHHETTIAIDQLNQISLCIYTTKQTVQQIGHVNAGWSLHHLPGTPRRELTPFFASRLQRLLITSKTFSMFLLEHSVIPLRATS